MTVLLQTVARSHCGSCTEPIVLTHDDGQSQVDAVWRHRDTLTTACDDGITVAAPAPHDVDRQGGRFAPASSD